MHFVETRYNIALKCAMCRLTVVKTILLIFCVCGILLTGPIGTAWSQEPSLVSVFAFTSYSGGRTFLTPQAVCVDADRGDVYVADTGNGRIVVFNSIGQYLTSFSHKSEPLGVAVDRAGQVYVTDSSSHLVHIYDYRGRATGKITPDKADADALFGRMAVDSADNLYVTVRNKGQVFVYDSKGAVKLKIGGAGEAGRIEMISDVAVDAEGRVYALSSLGDAVHVFNSKGESLFRFGKHAPGADNFAFPTAIDIDAQERIWVVDSFAHCLKVFSKSGSFITNIGGYFFPVSTGIWTKGNQLLVLEKGASRISGYRIHHGGTKE
jgi:hypothetical protein